MNRSEMAFIVVSFAVIFTFTQIPIMLGYAFQGDRIFEGRVLGLNNYHNLRDWAFQASEGRFLFTVHAMPEAISGYTNTYAYALGTASAVSGIGIDFMYVVFSVAGGLAFFFVLYKFISIYSSDRLFRRTAFIMALTSTGFGVLLWGFIKSGAIPILSEALPIQDRIFPVDLWVTDIFPFLSLYAYPYHILAITMMIGAFYLFLSAWKTASYPKAVLGGLAVLLLGSFHPYDPIIVYATITLFVFMRFFQNRSETRKANIYFTFILVSVWTTVMNLGYAFSPEFAPMFQTNIQLSPNILSYVIGIGIPFILGIVYMLMKFRDKRPNVTFLFAWAIAYLLLAYSPIIFQRKFVLGMAIPFAILSALFLFQFIKPRISYVNMNRLIAVLIVLMLPTGVFFIVKESFKVLNSNDYYITQEEYAQAEWIKSNLNPDDIVLSDMRVGGYLAGRGQRVFLGHDEIGTDITKKQAVVEQVYGGLDDRIVEDIIKEHNISYIWRVNEEERA